PPAFGLPGCVMFASRHENEEDGSCYTPPGPNRITQTIRPHPARKASLPLPEAERGEGRRQKRLRLFSFSPSPRRRGGWGVRFFLLHPFTTRESHARVRLCRARRRSLLRGNRRLTPRAR